MKELTQVGRSGRVCCRLDRLPDLSLVQVLLLFLCICLVGCGDDDPPTTPQGPAVTLLYPNGGEILQGGSSVQISWSASSHGTPAEALLISLDLSIDMGSTWIPIVTGLPNNNEGSFNWNVPTINTNEGRVRVTVRDGERTAQDISDGNFAIAYTPPPIRRNDLSVEDGEGAAGSEVTIDLILNNEDRIRMVQTEVLYDPAVVQWISADLAPRAEGMSLQPRLLQAGRLEIVMTHDPPGFLASGAGAIATLMFRLVGQADESSVIEPDNSLLLDDGGEAVNVTEGAGSITVTAPPARENTLAVGTASGASGTEVIVALDLDNEDPVKALQTDIVFDPGVVEYVGGAVAGRVGTMTYAASVVEGNTLRVIMYYADASAISAGTGTIADITFTLIGAGGTRSALTFASTTLSDPLGQRLPVITRNGSISVTGDGGGGNTLSIGTGSGSSGAEVSVPLSLANEDVVKGLQTDITFDPGVVEYAGGAATARAGTMTYAAAVVGEGALRVVLYYSDTPVLPPGSGAIADITFTLIGASGTQSALTPGSTELSDADANPLEVANEAGTITVLSKGDDK